MNAMMKLEEDADFLPSVAGSLSDMQTVFVEHMLNTGGNQKRSAELAGYSNPSVDAWRLMQLPHVQAALRAGTERMLAGAGPKSVKWMVDALDDGKLAGAVRFQCAKWLAEAAGHGLAAQRTALGLPLQDKPLSEMTLDELDAFISAGKAATDRLKQDRARTIEGEARNDARNVGHDEA